MAKICPIICYNPIDNPAPNARVRGGFYFAKKECDIVSPTCDTCAMYQGRVYSISGKDSRYPALYEKAFKSGYSIIHPNCRHSWSPYHEELYTEKEKREMLDQSNRSWQPDGDGRNFQQVESLRAQYARGQTLMRQWNGEIVEFERMRAYYKGQGQEPPYKTLGAFRRAVRQDELPPKIKAWRNRGRDKQQYERWKTIADKYMPQSLDEFQEIKYNKNKAQEFQQLKEIRDQEKDYKIAAEGGAHSGKLKDFVENYSVPRLEKSIRNYNKTIEEHERKINNPRIDNPDWDTFDERYQNGLIRKWNKDLERNAAQRNIAIALLRRRKENENINDDR